MPANYSELQICNKSLLRLAAKQVTSPDGRVATITTESLEAKLCKANYELIKDVVLEDRVWSFALQQIELPLPNINPPAFGYGQAFDLPANCLSLWRVYFSANKTGSANLMSADDWIVQGGQLLVNQDRVFLEYIKTLDSDEILLATPQFVDSLSLRLALEMCMPLTENAALYESLRAEYQQRLIEASAIDGQQAKHETFRSNRITGARSGQVPSSAMNRY